MSQVSSLAKLREKIEFLDRALIKVLGRRFRVTGKIQNTKKLAGIAIEQRHREKTLLHGHLAFAKQQKVPATLIKKIFKDVFYYSKKTGIL